MSKTLEETKQYIIESSKKCNLHEKTIQNLLDNIKTDKDGLVSEMEFAVICAVMEELAREREQTIRMLDANREYRNRMRQKRKGQE